MGVEIREGTQGAARADGQMWLNSAMKLANTTGADRLIGRRHKGVGAILMAHSLVAGRAEILDPNLQTSADFIDEMLSFYADIGVDVLSLDEALQVLASGADRDFVCFTFDDGYRDNLTLALPIFEKHRKPFTVYVCSALIDRTGDHRWGLLRQTIQRADRLELPHKGRTFDTSTPSRKSRAYRALARLMDRDILALDELEGMAAVHGLDHAQALEADFLSVDELRRLAQSPFVEIGGHTQNHPHLAQMPIEQARREIVQNREFIESVTGREVRHFAYPFGDIASCGPREFSLCAELGLTSATTTRFGGLFPGHLSTPTALPRIRFNGSCESPQFIECQRNGAVAALKTRFGNEVVTA